MIKKQWFSSDPRTKVRRQGPWGFARTQPWWWGRKNPGVKQAKWTAEEGERGSEPWGMPEMQPNDILPSCSDWSNVSALTDSYYWCQIFLHLVASGDSLFACSPVTHGAISSTPSLFHLQKVLLVGDLRVADHFCLWIKTFFLEIDTSL